MEFMYRLDDETVSVTVEEREGHYWVKLGERVHWVEIAFHGENVLSLFVDGFPSRACIAHEGGKTFIAIGGETYCLTKGKPSPPILPGEKLTSRIEPHEVLAPMPGKVMKVEVSPGAVVEAGQVLLTLEAMKMENVIVAERRGRVKRVHVEAGQMVEPGRLLVEFDEAS